MELVDQLSKMVETTRMVRVGVSRENRSGATTERMQRTDTAVRTGQDRRLTEQS